MYRIEFRLYRRTLTPPLQTHHGVWAVREGIVLRLSHPDWGVSWGEIAPIPGFGSESLEAAIALCQSLAQRPLTWETIATIPDTHPASQFGYGSAWESLHQPPPEAITLDPCQLLPTGSQALDHLAMTENRDRVWKWKIGVRDCSTEQDWLCQILQHLPITAKLRLDANGGLTWTEACRWLDWCDRLNAQPHSASVEFLEQPLPPDHWTALQELQTRYATPIALDESVATLTQLQRCYAAGWQGLFVIKPAIAGFPQPLRRFCQDSTVDVVWSSALETAIAQRFIQTRLIPSLPLLHRAIGFGVNSWFNDSLGDMHAIESLWQTSHPNPLGMYPTVLTG